MIALACSYKRTPSNSLEYAWRTNNGSEWALVDALWALPFTLQNNFPLLGKWITLSTGSTSLERSSNAHHCSSRPPRVSVVCLHLRSSPSGPVLKTLTAPWLPSLGNPILSILLHFQVYFSILYSLASSSVSTFLCRHWIVFKVKIEGQEGRVELL